MSFHIIYSLKLFIYWSSNTYVALRPFPGLSNPVNLEDFPTEKTVIIGRILRSIEASIPSKRETMLRFVFPIYWLWASLGHAIDQKLLTDQYVHLGSHHHANVSHLAEIQLACAFASTVLSLI